MSLLEKIKEVKVKALEELANIETAAELQDFKNEYLSKKGTISSFMQDLKESSVEEKKTLGSVINELKQEVSELVNEKYAWFENQKIEEALKASRVDVTLDARVFEVGKKHILSQIVELCENFFVSMGYTVEVGPEVETDENNFEKLNLPKDHPARDMQDSFYITENTLLRSQTSPVQVRTMLNSNGKDIKMICPGKVYRRDDDDATHSHQFMQLEGLVVDKKTSLADLKGTLLEFAKFMFGEDTYIRLRPSYFPFTEPSFEVDVTCFNCHGDGCSICKGTGLIEVLGCGMVHNNVLESCGYDPEVYQGFAFGMGVERMAMLKYQITDIRNIYINDKRFTKQF